MSRAVKIFLSLCLFSAFAVSRADAQIWKMRRIEASAGLGPSLFFGDVGGYSKSENILGIRDLSLKQARFDLNLNAKYRITQDVNARLSLTYGILHASDTRGSNEDRNMEAKTTIIEPALIAEYYFIKNRAENSYLFSKGRNNFLNFIKSLDVYAFSGFGVVNYSVDRNEFLARKGMDPKGIAPVIPVGVGANLIYSADLNFGIEIGGRYTFSDSLDNYTSQYSTSNDVYYLVNFTVTYKLKTGNNGKLTLRR